MPKYLIRKSGRKIDIVNIPKHPTKKEKEALNRNRKTIFKNYKEVTAKSSVAAISKVVGQKVGKKK